MVLQKSPAKTSAFLDFSLPITFFWKNNYIWLLHGFTVYPRPELPGVSLQNVCSLLGNMAVLLGLLSSPGIRKLSPVIFGSWAGWILGNIVVAQS